MSLLRDAEGRVRAPYVVAVFAAIAVVIELGLALVMTLAGFNHFETLDSPRVIFSTLPSLLAGAVATVFTWLAFREPTGLNDRHGLPKFGAGFLIGGAALTLCCGVPAFVGATSLTLNPSGLAVVGMGALQLLTLSPAGIGEELLLRGLGFQALRRGLGSIGAVALTSVLFGALHLFNPGATWLAALEVALVGAWFGALTVRTGSVWMSMGLHVAWNFFEGFVFGQPVSGNPPGTSLFIAGSEPPPGFWSGGAFGPEAAGWTAVMLTAGLALTVGFPRRSAVLT